MPLRNPVILAKELATLQFLSDNRVILGAGVGWNDAEYEAVGVHKSERGKRTDEMLDIMMPLLEGETRHLPRPVLLGRRRVHRADRRRSGPCCGSAAGRSWPTPSRRTCRKFVESVKARTVEATAGSRGRPARPRHRPRLGASCRRYPRARPATRATARRPRELPAPRPDQRPGQGARGAAPGVPQGHERRARPSTTSSRSTCSGRRTRSSPRSRRAWTRASSTSSCTR